jgi:hypothetical protein
MIQIQIEQEQPPICRQSTFEKTYFEYRGISVEINHPHGNYRWTYYLHLPLERFADESLRSRLWLRAKKSSISPKRKYFHTSKLPVLNNIYWHGGITWYSQEIQDGSKCIKVGCDYDHLWNHEQGYPESLNWVINDAKHSIDDLHDWGTTYLLWCGGNGELYKENDGRYIDGRFYSFDYIDKQHEEGRWEHIAGRDEQEAQP